MFKKLKEKITEEVKISPQRFQQLTQSVSDKLQGTSAPEENMFSIGEDDENSSNMGIDQGFSSVTLVSPSSDSKARRMSNSSIASDVSFLPRYEAGSLYHLQSDLDVSASELEDNVSQSSSQLGHLSKEQIYSAFQKSQMRYHKYRGRYTDLARHYKELERENAKMKSVLVESQDKAIRRVTELKEQCSLEQKAKAHLESALRDDLDEKQMKIQSLQTKIELLQQGQLNAEPSSEAEKKETNNIDSDKLEQLTKYLNDARAEIEALNGKIQEYKASGIVFQSKEQEYKGKIAALEKDISNFSEREKENNIKIAETKMELHNELLNKDSEISKLKKDMESLRVSMNAHEKENRSTKMENLQSQNNKLIEKMENLTQKCNGLENELLKVEKYKMDIRDLNDKNMELTRKLDEEKELLNENNKLENVISSLKVGLSTCQENLKRLTEEKQILIDTVQKEKQDYENQIQALRESAKKGLFTLEKQISEKLGQSYEEKHALLREEFEAKLKEISSNNQTVADVHLQLIEKEGMIKELSNELGEIKEKLKQKDNQYRELENNHLDLIEESSQLRSNVNNLEKQQSDVVDENSRVYEEKIAQLQSNIKSLQNSRHELQKVYHHKEEINVRLSKDNLNLENMNTEVLQKSRLLEEKQEASELETIENNLLEMKVQALEEEKKALLDSFEVERKLFNKVLIEHNEMKIKEIEIAELEDRNKKLEEKVLLLKGYLNLKENNIVEINKLKLNVEQELEKSKESLRIMEERDEAINMDKTECNLLQIKVQQLENEKDSLVKSFERERETFDQSFHIRNEEFESHKEDIIKENVELAKENLELKQTNDELFGKVRIIEERDQVVGLESSECSLLKLKLQELETEKHDLLKGFEMERELFNKILVEHRELKAKEEHITELQNSNSHLAQKIAKLKGYLKQKEDKIVKLHKDNLANEQEITKLNESLRIKEEQIDSLEIEKTECGLLEMKVKALEEENRNLLNSFEIERSTFEDALSKGSHMENKVDELDEKVILLTQARDDLTEIFKIEKQELIESFELERRNFQLTDTELRKVNQENLLLKEEKENLNSRLKEETDMLGGQINILKEEVSRLQNANENLRKEIDIRQEKLDELSTIITQLKKDNDALTKTLEKEQSEKKEAITKLTEMQNELDKNKSEIIEIKNSLEAVEKLYNEAKSQQTEDVRKLNELENEKIRLDKELKKKTDEFQFKAKELGIIEQQFSALIQEKENILQENKLIRTQLEEECENLRSLIPKTKEVEQVKKQNENLHKECDKLNQEISELKVRINQLSSDNRNVNEEHDRLVAESEEYKAKCEFLENEKGEFNTIRAELERERDSLRMAVTDLTEKLQHSQEEHSKISASTSDNFDLVQIQKNFLDIKEKCDKLHGENKNLKGEYAKLEEQCTNFSKVKKDLETQMTELERHYNEVLHEKQLLQDEIQELKCSPINASSNNGFSNNDIKLDNLSIVKQERSLLTSASSLNGPKTDNDRLQSEIEALKEKVSQYKSLDITNKSSIEFYENELQKIKNKNDKLNRKLDETLVTLNHCTDLSSSTEIEYLKNVLYNYMLGKESLVLARVIAAVCKFDPVQTEAVLQKEQQKQTLLGQLGIL